MRALTAAALFSALPLSVLGADVLSTNSFSTCLDNSAIRVDKLDVSYNKNTRKITFNVAGESTEAQNVTAKLVVSAYGKQFYEKTFSPCDEGMKEMCPVPAAKFASSGEQTVPEEYAKQIPAIAFNVPDLDGLVKMQLIKDGDNTELACIESTVENGKTMEVPAVKYAAAGIAAASLALTGLSALSAAGTPGAAAPSPTFGEVFGWFQSMALSGMMSVEYPKVYQSFSKNFGFSTGLVEWESMQTTIDNFRGSTGGNLTNNNYNYLKNATLVFTSGSDDTSASNLTRRAIEAAFLYARDGTTVSVDGQTASVGGDQTSDSTETTADDSKEQKFVKGIEAYVEQLTIPSPNTFMTLLLCFAIVVAAIIVLILLFKLILEAWSLARPLSPAMESWRKRYWWRLAKAITNLILLLYGIWTLYCIYQFTTGDSWAAKLLAGITFALFTAVLGWFTFMIWSKARESKRKLGDSSELYEDKEVWVRYSLLYDNYKKNYWWIFVPVIIYMFTRGCVIAGANGHGLIQSAGQLIVEACMLCLLLWSRPFSLKSSNWINCVIQTVRVISVVCVLVFVEELGMSKTTKTVTGVVLIVVQGVLTGVLAILIAVNALIFCIKKNPHREARKDAEKARIARDLDNLTPLDARNSMLMEPMSQKDTSYKAPIISDSPFATSRDHKGGYDAVPTRAESPDSRIGRGFSRPNEPYRDHSVDGLVGGAAGMGYRDHSEVSREPRLPDMYGQAR